MFQKHNTSPIRAYPRIQHKNREPWTAEREAWCGYQAATRRRVSTLCCLLWQVRAELWSGVSARHATNPQPIGSPSDSLPLKSLQAKFPTMFFLSGRAPRRERDWQVEMGKGKTDTKKPPLNSSLILSSALVSAFTHKDRKKWLLNLLYLLENCRGGADSMFLVLY